MLTCDTPAANREFSIYQDPITLTSIGGFLKDATCDENGYFKVTYKPKNGSKLSIRSKGIVLENIPCKKNLNIGKVYINPSSMNIVLKIKANQSYTSSDTLYYYDLGTSHLEQKIAGPFVSGIIDTVESGGYMQFPLRYNELPILSIDYYINSPQNKKNIVVNSTVCSSFSEAVLVIE